MNGVTSWGTEYVPIPACAPSLARTGDVHRRAYLVVHQLLRGIIFLEHREEIDDIGVLGRVLGKGVKNKKRIYAAYIVVKLVACGGGVNRER